MTARFVSQDLEWTESMKEHVRQKIIYPLEKYFANENFHIAIHLDADRKRMDNRKPYYEMWAVLQTFDGRKGQVIRRQGEDFWALTNELSACMRSQLAKQKNNKRVRVEERYA